MGCFCSKKPLVILFEFDLIWLTVRVGVGRGVRIAENLLERRGSRETVYPERGNQVFSPKRLELVKISGPDTSYPKKTCFCRCSWLPTNHKDMRSACR